jgi:hypothetical protein
LFGFIGLSLFAHAATFFVFQAVYPERVTIPPPAPQVALLTGATPEHLALLRWVAAEDPALVVDSTGAEPPQVMEIPYRPSYATLRTPPRSAPDETERPEQAPSPIVLPFGPEFKRADAPQAPPPVATSVRLAGPLAARTLVRGGQLALKASAPLQPARFLIGLSAKGEARFSFLQDSSGDSAADRAAAAWLASAAFSPGEPAIAWGTATIEWGSDAYPPNGVAK